MGCSLRSDFSPHACAPYLKVMHPDDAQNMNLTNKLRLINQNKSKEILVKRYLLDCCVKLIRFRSGECLPKNLKVARNFLRGVATKKQIHQSEWEIEGNAFGTEYYSEQGVRVYFRVNKDFKADLVQVRISKGLNNRDSRKYLIEMAYFIDYVFCHIQFSSDWLFEESCDQFMCPRLFERYFG